MQEYIIIEITTKEDYSMKLYLAGALFNEAEVAQRLKEGRLLSERFGDRLSVFNR